MSDSDVRSGKAPIISIREASPLVLLLVPILAFAAPNDARTDVLGFASSVIAFVMFVPQAARVWRERNDPHALLGVSMSTQFMILANATIWGVYAFLLSEFWVGAPGLVNAPLAIAVIVLIVRSRLALRRGELDFNGPDSEMDET